MPRLISYIFLGIMIVIFVVGLVLLSYLLIIGSLVGVVLFAMAWFKEKFFPTKTIIKKPPEKRPRTFDHQD